MDGSLSGQKCTVCSAGAPQLTDAELADYRRRIPDWRVETVGGVRRLVRVFTFRDFASALRFTDKVGAAAEEEGHHPVLLTEWGRATVSWWTHKIGGLHRNDVIMAAKTDEIWHAAEDA